MITQKVLNVVKHTHNITLQVQPNAMQPTIYVPREHIIKVMKTLKDHPKLFFDYLECISGVDYGPQKNIMEIVYHIQSIPYGHFLVIKTVIPRKDPWTYSVVNIWRGADWHEREIYDLFGIKFKGHPCLKRILMPEDWIGHPLRKDYVQFKTYKGINCLTENPEKGGKVSL